MYVKRWPVGASIAWLALVGLAEARLEGGTIRADLLDSQYTSLANQSLYNTVGKFAWSYAGSSYLASGILIDNQWVLTAAHVVSDITSSNIGTMTFSLGGTTYHAAETHFDSGWTGSVNGGHDIGIVKLDAPVSGITPASLYTGTAENHLITTVVGYGSTGTGLTGAVQSAGTKRAGTNVIGLGSALNSISWSGGGNDTMLVADFDAPGTTGDPTTNLAVATGLEYCAAPGDSGGGWFIDIGGQPYLAGVTSFLLSNPANPVEAMYGDIFGATRVSSYLDWIWNFVVLRGDTNLDGTVNALDISPFVSHLTSGTYLAEADMNADGAVNALDISAFVTRLTGGAAAVPEPGTAALVVLTSGMLVRRRARR
jgi:secreted trypsin-like serine protease